MTLARSLGSPARALAGAAALIVMALAAQGCSTIGLLVGTTIGVLKGGSLTRVEPLWFEDAHVAALESLSGYDSLRMKKKNAFGSRIEFKTPEGKKVRVDLKRRGEAATEIHIKVGRLGDEEFTVALYHHIKAYFEKTPTWVEPTER